MVDNKTLTIIVAVSVVICGLLIIIVLTVMAQVAPKIRKKSRITNRKQFSRLKVEEELFHNVRYISPDSVSVSLATVQPRSNRRQTLPAISLCKPNITNSSTNNSSTDYGSIELIRPTSRRYSDISFSRSDQNERTRKISLDSQLLSRICEESSEIYENESRRGSMRSFFDKDVNSHSELDMDLYSSTDEISSNSVSGCGLGRLHFVANYNKSLDNLYVTILKASYVRSSLIKETSCVYVKIGLLPAEMNYPLYRTSCVTSMGNPMFNQTFTFHITEFPEQLQLTVKEVRKLESNRVVGYVWFDMKNMLKENSNLDTTHEISREIFGENKLYRRRGDVLVNIKISVQDVIEINVYVAEARNLLIKNQNTSVYVRASILIYHKVQQTKNGQIIKHSISSPCFNDRFKFLIPNTKESWSQDHCCVMLCFCSRSRVRISRLIGRCIIGPMIYTEGDGLIQWNEAISKPGITVSQWLSLT